MQVRTTGAAGGTGVTQQLALPDDTASLDLDAVQVPVNGAETVVVHQLHHLAQPAGCLQTGPLHHPVTGGMDRCATGCPEVQAPVHGP